MRSRTSSGASAVSARPASRPSANACVLRTRFFTAVLAIPLLVWVVVWNPWSLFTWLVAVASVVGVSEYFTMAFPEERIDRWFGIAAGTLVVIAMIMPMTQLFA